jgi:hypothetical protein
MGWEKPVGFCPFCFLIKHPLMTRIKPEPSWPKNTSGYGVACVKVRRNLISEGISTGQGRKCETPGGNSPENEGRCRDNRPYPQDIEKL